MAGLVPAISIHVAISCHPKRDHRAKPGDDKESAGERQGGDTMKRVTLALCALLIAPPAFADTVKIVVPFAAGGPVDQLARILSNDLGAQLGADVIVEPKGGAGGAIGSETVARSAPDGRTLLLASMGSHIVSPALRAPSGYDPVKGFEPVMLIGS